MNSNGFKRVSDNMPVDITQLPADDKGLFYKDEPYTTKKLHQRLIITYSPKYALYQKSIRNRQVERAQKMLASGNTKKNRKNPNDPARFIGTAATTKDGESADIHHYLDESKIEKEAKMKRIFSARMWLYHSHPSQRKSVFLNLKCKKVARFMQTTL